MLNNKHEKTYYLLRLLYLLIRIKQISLAAQQDVRA